MYDAKGIIRIRKSKKDRQHNGQKIKGQTTMSYLMFTIHIVLCMFYMYISGGLCDLFSKERIMTTVHLIHVHCIKV